MNHIDDFFGVDGLERERKTDIKEAIKKILIIIGSIIGLIIVFVLALLLAFLPELALQIFF